MVAPLRQDVLIRPETSADHDAIASVVAAAFQSQVLADLVVAIRGSPQYIAEFALVAERGGEVVGHVMVSVTGLCDDTCTHLILHLSPLAVAPAHQGQGVGGALVRAVTSLARLRGAPFVILQGDPRYYSRFGFEASAQYDITMQLPSWAPIEAAQILLLNGERPLQRGRVVHAPAFAAFPDD